MPKSAALLVAPDKKLSVTKEEDCIIIDVPTTAPDAVDAVITLKVEGSLEVRPLPTLGASATASVSAKGSEPANALDGTGEKRWIAPPESKLDWLEVILTEPTAINAFGLDEPDVWPRMKQNFTLEASVNEQWIKVTEGKTNGHGLKQNITPVTSQKFRLTLECEKGSPGVAEIQLYRAE